MTWSGTRIALPALVLAVFAGIVPAGTALAHPIPAIPAASLRCHAAMTNNHPADYASTGVKVRTVPYAGIKTVAHYRTVNHPKRGNANAQGRRTIWYYISGATPGHRVVVDVYVWRHHRHGSCSTSFTPAHHTPLFGIFDQCVPGHPACAARIEHALPLSLAVTYAPLRQHPPLATLKAIHRDGLMPVLVADPYRILKLPGSPRRELGVPARKIAAGDFDGYLRWYADQLRSLRFRVGLSFGHEMNGDWYPWGYSPACKSLALDEHSQGPPNSPGRTPPRLFVKAWRHLHDVFTQQKAGNVTWIWTVSRLPWRKGCSSPRGITRADWPGSRYVNWIGIDGYLTGPASRFVSRLAPTVGFVRSFARKPVLIQETGVWPGGSQWAQFRSLVLGVRYYHLLGWVYENRDGKLGPWALTPREELSLGRLLRRDGYGGGG